MDIKADIIWFLGYMKKRVLYFLIFFSFFNSYAYSTPKKIMFLVHTETIGGKGVYELYKEMKQLNHDVKIVAIPSFYHEELLLNVDTDFVQKFDKNDVVFPCGKAPPYKKCESIEEYQPDYIFIQNPYDSYSGSILDPYYLTSNLKKFAKKVMYIVYGPHLFHQDFINDTNLPNLIDTVFVDSKSTKDIFVKKFKFPKNSVVVSGYITYKSVRDNLKKSSARKKTETILWLPRWSLSFRNKDLFEGGSTFLSYYHFFHKYAKENPHIHFIIRPHYNLFSYAIRADFLSQKDVDEILGKFRSLKNVTLSMHTARPLVDDILASDVVISDGSSALAEVVVADKPIIYLSNGWNNEFNSNELSREFKNYLYLAYSPEEIIYYLNYIRKTNYHPYPEVKSNSIKSWLAYLKRRLFNQPCTRDEFKKMLDPVENPVQLISKHL